MAHFVQLVPLFLFATLVQEPVAADQLKCWTCTSDLMDFCKNQLVNNATNEKEYLQTCAAGESCRIELTALDNGKTMVSRGCAKQCNPAHLACVLCTTNECNSGACLNKDDCKKNGGGTLETSVALMIASFIVLYFK